VGSSKRNLEGNSRSNPTEQSSYGSVSYSGVNFRPLQPNVLEIARGLAQINLETGAIEVAENVEITRVAEAFFQELQALYGGHVEQVQRRLMLERDEEIRSLRRKLERIDEEAYDFYQKISGGEGEL